MRKKRYTINDHEREIWVLNDDFLYGEYSRWVRGLKGGMRGFIRENRHMIDAQIKTTLKMSENGLARTVYVTKSGGMIDSQGRKLTWGKIAADAKFRHEERTRRFPKRHRTSKRRRTSRR